MPLNRMSVMKIIQVIARLNQGGTARWIETLVDGLRDLNHEVILLSGSVESNEIEDSSFVHLGAIRVPGLGRSVSITKDFKCIFALRRIFKSEKPDLINTHTAKAGALARVAALGIPIKVVHTFHGHLLYGYFSSYKIKMFVFIEKILSLQTNALIAVGRQVRDDLVESGVANSSKFHIIEPGIKIIKAKGRLEARKNYSIGTEDFVVGWLGRLVKIKRPDVLLEIAEKIPEAIFLVGGAGELEEIIASHKGINLKFVGWALPEEFWPACDIALLTSDNEGLPTALIEAAMCEVPIVAKDVGSVKEIFEENIGGFLFEDSNQAVERIRSLINDKIATRKAGIAAKQFANSRFSEEIFIQKHLDLYESLI
jgi:glycosyltransferase involved in cell wall biosynthesis